MVAIDSSRSAGPYIPDIPMAPSPSADTVGPAAPSLRRSTGSRIGRGPGAASLRAVRLPRRRRVPPATKLHIGAFDVVHDGWLNTDVTPHLAIARVPGLPAALRRAGRLSEERWAAYRDGTFAALHYLDLTQPLPYPDGAF